MLQKKEQEQPISSMTLELNDEVNFDSEIENEINAIEKVLTKTKPKMIRKNIEYYLEERALKRRVQDVFEDELLLL